MTTKDDELRRLKEARAAKAVAEIIEDLSTRDELGDEWRCTTLAEQDSIKRTWQALILKAILAACVVMIIPGCFRGFTGPAKKYVSHPATAKVEAGHILAYSARAPRSEQPQPSPQPKPKPDGQPSPESEPTQAQVEAAAAKPGWLEGMVQRAISKTVDEKLSKSDTTWEEIRELKGQVKRIAAWVDSFPSPKKQGALVTPGLTPLPVPRCLLFSGPKCDGCKALIAEIKADKSHDYIINDWDGADIQIVDIVEHPEIAARHHIREVPALVIVRGTQEIARADPVDHKRTKVNQQFWTWIDFYLKGSK